MLSNIHIRLINDSDSLEKLTELLHTGYKSLADQGFRSLATHQDEATTKKRIEGKECYLVLNGAQMIGTICYRPPHPAANESYGHPWYNQPFIASFGQFTVHPQFQNQGIGSRLIEFAERAAIRDKAIEISLDTPINNEQLRSYYAKRGYREVAQAQWKEVNYRSVLLSKKLV